MANANDSVFEALRPVAVATTDATTAVPGQTVSLDGSGSFASNNRAIVGYLWTVVSSSGEPPVIANADMQHAAFTATNGGIVTLRLTVTDNQGVQGAADVVVNTPAPPAVVVTVSPSTASVSAGGGTQAFTATVENTSNTVVTWQVGGVTGGNSTVGTISTSGLYTAPATVPSVLDGDRDGDIERRHRPAPAQRKSRSLRSRQTAAVAAVAAVERSMARGCWPVCWRWFPAGPGR